MLRLFGRSPTDSLRKTPNMDLTPLKLFVDDCWSIRNVNTYTQSLNVGVMQNGIVYLEVMH